MNSLSIFNNFISTLGILSQILIIFLIFILIFKNNPNFFYLFNFFQKNSFLFSFIISLTATLASLFYFEIFGVEPCLLCWYQRIFMYPQTILLGLYLFQKNKDKNFKNYIIILSFIGIIFALYHNIIQINSKLNTICSINNTGINLIDCSQKYIIGLDYITIPFMSLLSFGLIFILMLFNNKKE